MTATDKENYTKVQKYWEQTPPILEKAKELKTPEAIYHFVVDYLIYDYSRVTLGIERLGAQTAFEKPTSAVCMEFSDLFVALSRAAGIPARVVNGYAYTTNSRLQPLSLVGDVLHAWPEYYDAQQELWIPVDPTWGHTTHGVDYFHQLDFNHIAFAILGMRSDYPYPAGSFKEKATNKDVFVSFIEDRIEVPEEKIVVELAQKTSVTSGKSTEISFTIHNPAMIATRPQLKLTTVIPFEPIDSDIFIAPLGKAELGITVKPPPQWVQTRHQLTIMINGSPYTTMVTIHPVYWPYLPFIFLGLLLFAILARYAKRRTS